MSLINRTASFGATVIIGLVACLFAIRPARAQDWNASLCLDSRTLSRERLTACETAIKKNPKEAGLHRNHAAVLFFLGQPAAALLAYERSDSLLADQPETMMGAAAALEKLGRTAAAIKQYRRSIELDSTRIEAYVGLARVYGSANRPAEAVALLRKALAVFPESPIARTMLGSELVKQGRPKEGVAHLDTMRALKPRIPAMYFLAASALDVAGRRKDALLAIRVAVELSPEYPYYRAVLASILEREKLCGEAILEYERLTSKVSGPAPWGGIARCSVALRDYDRAISAWERATLLDSTYWSRVNSEERSLYQEAKRIVKQQK